MPVYKPSKDALFKLLSKLCSVVGPSGFEEDVRGIVIDELKPYADKLWIDSLGNVIAVKKGSRGSSKLMIATHMDEIGLMINHIDDKGFLRFTPIGAWTERILLAQRVLIKTKDGKIIRGVIGSKPPHIMKPEEAQKVVPMKELFIDIGVKSREEAEKLGVTIGSVAVMDRDVVRLGGDTVSGRAFDDRIGVTVLVEAFKALEDHEVDVYAVATVQEEVGLKGARVAAFAIEPHVALAIDVTVANDIPGVPEHEWVTRVGKGPAIKIMDGRSGSGLIAHPAVRELLIKAAEEEKIPYQLEVLPGGTTDASIIQLNKEGVPAGTISVPTRYVHSPIELLSLEDALNTVKLVLAFTKRITREWIEKNLKREIK